MTTYTMTLTDVQAWQVQPDGSLPEAARQMVTWFGGEWWPVSHAWRWYSETQHEYQLARPGDWVVRHDYDLEAMTDEQFKACCRPDDGMI